MQAGSSVTFTWLPFMDDDGGQMCVARTCSGWTKRGMHIGAFASVADRKQGTYILKTTKNSDRERRVAY